MEDTKKKKRIIERKVRVWDNSIVIAEVQKSDSLKFIISACAKEGVRYVYFREYYYRKRDNAWIPLRAGTAIPLIIPVEKGTRKISPFVEITEAMKKAAEVGLEMPIADPDGAVYFMKKEFVE